ncbi:copper chaperone PCu(A)C [Microbulbifer bruguierae]|uniref:Copper chaperone PCu(A)C n=1 Tax=Microbulbifer bruguierae TaxID=3029061 RepID=A0ABY8N948_9GAMM|nr:copper chaperone PCu(A)C [Microbulbifer bruguierae]WGL15005.1 copper chaperone PCu(A)C [Microbulbifer bruguierae]
MKINLVAIQRCLLGLALLALPVAAVTTDKAYSSALAQQLEVTGYAREMPPGAVMGAAYVSLRDLSGSARVLAQVELPAHPQASVAMHTTAEVEGVSRMRPLENITLPGNGTVEMRPGATHLMVRGVALKAGESLPLRLVFADGSMHELVLPIRGMQERADTRKPAAEHSDHQHHSHHHGE